MNDNDSMHLTELEREIVTDLTALIEGKERSGHTPDGKSGEKLVLITRAKQLVVALQDYILHNG